MFWDFNFVKNRKIVYSVGCAMFSLSLSLSLAVSEWFIIFSLHSCLFKSVNKKLNIDWVYRNIASPLNTDDSNLCKGIFRLRHDMPAIFGIPIIWAIKYSLEDESF